LGTYGQSQEKLFTEIDNEALEMLCLLKKNTFFANFVIFKEIELPLNIKNYCSNFPQSVFSANGTNLRINTLKYTCIDLFFKIPILEPPLCLCVCTCGRGHTCVCE